MPEKDKDLKIIEQKAKKYDELVDILFCNSLLYTKVYDGTEITSYTRLYFNATTLGKWLFSNEHEKYIHRLNTLIAEKEVD